MKHLKTFNQINESQSGVHQRITEDEWSNLKGVDFTDSEVLSITNILEKHGKVHGLGNEMIDFYNSDKGIDIQIQKGSDGFYYIEMKNDSFTNIFVYYTCNGFNGINNLIEDAMDGTLEE